MSGAAAVRSLRPLRAVVVPGWLAEVVRPRRAPVPWPEMARAALAICVPLSASSCRTDETLKPVTDAVRALLGVLGTRRAAHRVEAGLAVVGWLWSGWPDSNRRPPRPKRGALAKLRYSPYLAECSGCPGMFAVRTGSDPAVPGFGS